MDSLFHVASGLPRPLSPAGSGKFSRNSVDDIPVVRDTTAEATVKEILREYLEEHLQDVCDTFPAASEVFEPRSAYSNIGIPKVNSEIWPIILADAIESISRCGIGRTRDHLVALYIARVFSYWDEIEGLPVDAINKLLDDQSERVASEVMNRRIEFRRPTAPASFERGRWLPYASW
jgi:hypothetical protein